MLYALFIRRTSVILSKIFILLCLDFTIPPQCKRDIRSSWMLHSVDWYIFTDISGKMVLTVCSEASVTNYQTKLCNIPEERIPHLQCGGSLDSSIARINNCENITDVSLINKA